MLLKTANYRGLEIYRKGIGYYYKLNYLMTSKSKEAIYWILSNYTNMKFIKFNMKFRPRYIIDIMVEVIRFNIKKRMTDEVKNTPRMSEEDSIGHIIDILAGSYGWTIEYILENVDVFQLDILLKAINRRDKNIFTKYAMATHDPKGLMEMLNPEVEELSLDEVMNKISNIKTPYTKEEDKNKQNNKSDVFIRSK